MSDKENPEQVEETTETENPYEPGGGNTLLDSLFSLEDGETPPEPEEESVEDPTASTIAMSLTDSLAAIADAPPEEEEKAEPVPEPVQQKEENPEEEKLVKREDLSDAPDYFDEIDKHLAGPPISQQEHTPTVLQDMTPDELEEYRLSAYASKNFSDHSDAEKDFLEFHAKKKSFLEKARSEDPEFEETLENPEYAEFVSRNRPDLSASDRRRVEKAMLKDEVMGEVRGELSKNQQKDALAKRTPAINKRAEDYLNELADDILPAEVKETLDKGGLEVARVQHAMEMPTLHHAVTEAHAFGSMFLELSNGLLAYNAADGQHKAVLDFVEGQGDIFAKQGGKDRFRGESKFVPRSKYHRLAKKEGFWTFSDNEILEMIKFYAKQNASEALEGVKSKVEAYSEGSSEAKPKKQSAPVPAPKARPTKSTGATSSAEDHGTSLNPVLQVLGL